MIAYVGIDAHTTNYTLSTYLEGSAAPVNTNAYSPSVSNIVNYCKGSGKRLEMIQRSLSDMKLAALGLS